MENFVISRMFLSGVAFLVAFFLLGYWLFTGLFWQDTRGIDWLVYILCAERLLPIKRGE